LETGGGVHMSRHVPPPPGKPWYLKIAWWEGCGGAGGEVAQTMYTHMNKCIDN
jgi:hypothetical protein